jgi:hypothetical protein
MTIDLKPAWFPVTRSGLAPTFLAYVLILLSYIADINASSEIVLAFLIGVTVPILFVFVVELLIMLLKYPFRKGWEFWEALRHRPYSTIKLVVVIGLCLFTWDWFFGAGPFLEGAVTTQEDQRIHYELYESDQSIHYYMERKYSRDGIVVIILCTEGSDRLAEKTYVRCLYRKPGIVTGRPPMRAPGSWVTGPLTEHDKRLLEALRAKGVIK